MSKFHGLIEQGQRDDMINLLTVSTISWIPLGADIELRDKVYNEKETLSAETTQ